MRPTSRRSLPLPKLVAALAQALQRRLVRAAVAHSSQHVQDQLLNERRGLFFHPVQHIGGECVSDLGAVREQDALFAAVASWVSAYTNRQTGVIGRSEPSSGAVISHRLDEG